jgi:hypothetical protein
MATIDIDALHQELAPRIPPHARAFIEIRVVGESGLSIRINGKNCLTSIGVWPNGCCDVDYLFVESERGQFNHYEFARTEDAIEPVAREIDLAVERSL